MALVAEVLGHLDLQPALEHAAHQIGQQPTVTGQCHLVEAMYEADVRGFLQLGVGSTPGFVEDVLGSRPHLAISLVERGRSARAQARQALAALWVDGYEASHADLLT